MPAWWQKKSSRNNNKEESLNQSSSQSQSQSHGKLVINSINKIDKERARSLENVIVTRSSRDNGFSGFESDSIEKIGHPLPRPSISDIIITEPGSGSGSVSSDSSNDSSSPPDEDLLPITPPTSTYRGSGEIRFNLNTRSKSPGPGARGSTCPTSPLHPRLSAISLESTADGKSQCHRLPLPPGSPSFPPGSPTMPPGSPTLPPGSPTRPPGSPTFPPTSPSSSPAMHNSRCGGMTDQNMYVTSSKWKKGKLLGRGTFGHVYLSFNSESGQMCAIKEVRGFSDDQSSRERLKQLNQEINLLSQLSHPNIVRYYGSELCEESLCVFLEFVSGGSIHKLLQEYGPFREPVIQTYTRQILSGLAYLHGRNTVHRDIKGANILVDPNGEIKLADFGMAKHITAATAMLSFKGSPYWMAPEVVMNTNGYTLAVDIWSLGCTVFEMATAKPPWSQFEGVAAIFKIGNSKDLPEIPDHLSSDAKSFVKLCLQREPSARPTAAQLLDHPFVRDQAMTRVSNTSLTRDHAIDGTRTPPMLEVHSQRNVTTSGDIDFAMRPLVTNSRNPRDNSRIIKSSPVSPCSSPLRQNGQTHRNFFLSPPHPNYAFANGQSNYNLNLSPPSRPNSRPTHDPLLRTQSPVTFPGPGRVL
ncbi:hypothetical protein ACFE04_015773 [Oxalis oulophora]